MRTQTSTILFGLLCFWLLACNSAKMIHRFGSDVVYDKVSIYKKKTEQLAASVAVSTNEIPLYLSLAYKSVDAEQAKKLATFALERLESTYSNEQIWEDLEEIFIEDNTVWNYPPNFHTTTMFLGWKTPTDDTLLKEFERFTEGIEIDATIGAIAYSPGHIIAGIVFLDRNEVFVQNKFPHVTLLTGDLTAKYSNDLIEALAENDSFNEYYNKKFEGLTNPLRYSITLKGKKADGFVIPLKAFNLKGVTKKYWN